MEKAELLARSAGSAPPARVPRAAGGQEHHEHLGSGCSDPGVAGRPAGDQRDPRQPQRQVHDQHRRHLDAGHELKLGNPRQEDQRLLQGQQQGHDHRVQAGHLVTKRGPCKQRGPFLNDERGNRCLKDQAPCGRSASFAGKIIDGIAHRCSGLLNLVLESAGGIHQMGLDLLGFTLSLHAVVAGDIAGSSLKPSFGVLGGGLDLVFETH
jgi:hypothetical protein